MILLLQARSEYTEGLVASLKHFPTLQGEEIVNIPSYAMLKSAIDTGAIDNISLLLLNTDLSDGPWGLAAHDLLIESDLKPDTVIGIGHNQEFLREMGYTTIEAPFAILALESIVEKEMSKVNNELESSEDFK